MKRKDIHRRIWLAPKDPDSLAYASYHIDEWTRDGDMEIVLSDCTRIINLTLNNKQDQRKIERLIAFLQEAVDVHVQERNKP